MSISLSIERYEEIKCTVVDLFVDLNVCCVPVSGFEIAQKMGIKVIPYSSYSAEKRALLLKKSNDGFCVEKTTGEWYIFYNDAESYGRINNTMLHEIGHIVLDHTEDSELADKETNFFAKYALVPPVLVHKLRLKTASEIARVFAVSYQAAEYALAYYFKWLKYGAPKYTDYELTLLQLFSKVS